MRRSKEEIAQDEYNRLLEIYHQANADEYRIAANSNLIMKVAELYAILESMKDLPTIIIDPKNKANQRETAVGKTRVKYMAQYSSCMLKLNKDLLGTTVNEDDELEEFE